MSFLKTFTRVVTAPFLPVLAPAVSLIKPSALPTVTGGLLTERDALKTQKAIVGGGAGAASGFVASGFNPGGALAGLFAGGLSGGLNKRSLGDSALQSSAYGGVVGGLFGLAGAFSGAGKAANLGALKTGATATSSTGGFWNSLPKFSGFGDAFKTAGLLGVMQQMGRSAGTAFGFIQPSQQDQQLQDAARDLLVSTGQRPDILPAPMAESGGFNPLLLIAALLVPGGLLLYWLTKKKKH